MKKKGSLLLFLSFLVIASCSNKSEKDTGKDGTKDTISVDSTISVDTKTDTLTWKFDSLSYNKRVPGKDGMLVDIRFKYPVSAPTDIDLQKVQTAFSRNFAKGINGINPTNSPQDVYKKVVNEHVEGAKSQAVEFKDIQSEYITLSSFEDFLKNDIENISKYVITVSSASYQYMGGAHGSSHISFDNIDLRNGSIIQESKLFKAGYKIKLATLIQTEVERRNKSKVEDEHIALLVDISEIQPNENFHLSKEGIVYVYNQYEISPYVQGIVEITIPYNKIKPLLNSNYLEVIENI